MQERHHNNELYFNELATSCREYYIPYLEKFLNPDRLSVFEIGCGQGGNLFPFYQRNCNVVGIDLSEQKIAAANELFADRCISGASFEFRAENFYQTTDNRKYDLILVHDVIEHVSDKQTLVNKARDMLTEKGVLFFKFPAWNMPFGGHQQICSNKIASVLPFTHLLPAGIYKRYLELFSEDRGTIDELLDIKVCKTTTEMFEKIASEAELKIMDRTLWFINPHYKVKFGLKPVVLNRDLSRIKYLRDFLATSCFYLLQRES